jgi:RNA polymerase sigma-70 factor (ECF subfamily)
VNCENASDEGNLVESEAWQALIAGSWSRMYRSALRLLKQPHEAEDATQEAFTAAVRSRHRFDPQRPVEPWLFGILNHICLKRLRNARRRATTPLTTDLDPTDHQPIPPLQAIQTEDYARIRDALDALPDRERYLIVAKFYQELSNAEIGQQLNLTANAVGVALFRAMAHLRQTAGQP